MPTTRGWAALGIGLALPILWFAFGEAVMLAVGTFLVFAVLIGIALVRAATPSISISRTIAPLQVHDGDRAVVRIGLVASRTIHAATVTDEVHGLGTARFTANRIEADTPIEARYEVLCRPRGVYRIGPATVVIEDPLGVAESIGLAHNIDRLVVFPAVEDLTGLPAGRGLDPSADATRASFSQVGGEDFFTLREYQVGDDLRRVHWPTSAKRDELMIRQLEAHWQSKALLILDPRAISYADDASFEHAVSGIASVLRHFYRSGYRPTLWAGGSSFVLVDSADTYARAMEELAMVRVTEPIDLTRALASQRGRQGTGGVLLMMTGVPDDPALAAFRTLDRDFDRRVLMAVGDDQETGTSALLGLARGGVNTVFGAPGTPWARTWKQAMERSWSTATAG